MSVKDNEYTKVIKKQNDDIDELIKNMMKQFIDMRSDYKDQLTQIEKQFLREREEILKRNGDEIKNLFDD